MEGILIVYATRTGSTKEVAVFIGQTLTELGERVEVLPVSPGIDLSAYKAVIVGSAIQAGKLMPEALEFIQKNLHNLKQKPFAVFLVCMTLAMKAGDKYRPFVSGWLNPVRAMITPASEGLFSGKLDIRKVPSFSERLKFRLSVLFGVWKEGDHRDWNLIEDWAKNLKVELEKLNKQNTK